jgi:hypothetical protein
MVRDMAVGAYKLRHVGWQLQHVRGVFMSEASQTFTLHSEQVRICAMNCGRTAA